MANKKSTSRPKSSPTGKRAVLMMVMVAALGVAGFAAYVKLTPGAARVPDNLRLHSDQPDGGPNVDISVQRPSSDTTRTDLKIPVAAGTDVSLAESLPPVPDGMDARVFLLTQAFQRFHLENGRALGIEMSGKNAIVDINDAVRDHGYGSMQESQLVKVIGMALGQFPEIDTFQLRDGGQIVDSLGHFEMTDPVAVIRPGQSDSSAQNGESSAASDRSKTSSSSPQLGPN